MESEDELDYMSDAFLKSICGKDDIRPGLIKSHAQQHSHKVAVNKIRTDELNKKRNPSITHREITNREDGLSKPLDCENVGFKMLQKLGFKPGAGLGKQGEGRVEPIAMDVKNDRQGLGRKSLLEEKARLRAKFRIEVKEKQVDDYRLRKAEEAAEKKATIDLWKCQRVCWELDSKECIEEPAELWFWPENKLPQNYDEDNNESYEVDDTETAQESEENNAENEQEAEENEFVEEEEEEFSIQEKVEMLTLYLRRTYLYCVWCGHEFDDEKDMQQVCPGLSRDDH